MTVNDALVWSLKPQLETPVHALFYDFYRNSFAENFYLNV